MTLQPLQPGCPAGDPGVSALVVCDLIAAVGETTRSFNAARNVAWDSGDRSPKTKAVTGYRTLK
jgi:hypothetical protein